MTNACVSHMENNIHTKWYQSPGLIAVYSFVHLLTRSAGKCVLTTTVEVLMQKLKL